MTDDGMPQLGVGFLIEANYDELLRLQQFMGSTEMKVLRDAASIERATSGMIGPGATMQITAFGAAATKEMRAVARETAAAERAGEAMVRKLERENATFGKSRMELRHMRSEERALAAERVGNTDLAMRLRQQESQLWAKEYDVIRQAGIARKNAAEDAAEAEIRAQRSVIAQLRERAALEEALYRNAGLGRLSATDGGASFSALASREAEDEARRLAAAKEIESAAVREAAAAHRMFEAAVQQGSQAMREQAELSRAADQLRASLDPSIAAQQRFNQEMEQAQHLISRGAISLDEYVAKLQMEQSALDGLQGALARGAKSAGAHRQAMTGVSYQIQDVMTQISMGQNPINALAVNGAQLAGQFANIEGKAGALARFMMGPWGLAITGAVMVVGMLTKGLFNGAAAAKEKEKAAKELAQQMDNLYDANMRAIKSERQLQEATLTSTYKLWERAEQTRLTTIKTLELTRAELVRSQGLSRDIGGHAGMAASADAKAYAQQIADLDALLIEHSGEVKRMGEAYNAAKIPVMQAAVNEVMDAGAASLGRYDRAVGQLNSSFAQGTINATEYGYQYAKLTATRDAEQKAIDEANKKDRTGLSAAERRAASIARESISLQQKIAGLLDLANAYGISDAAAAEAEAAARAHEKAIRKQADLTKFVADELRRTAAERVAQTAKSTADLNYQSQVQEQVNQSIRAGTLDISRMGEAVSDLMARREAAAALKLAENDGDPALIAAATKAWNELTSVQLRSNQVREATLDLQRSDAIAREIEELQKLSQINAETARAREQILSSSPEGFEQEMQLARVNAQHEKQLILMRALIEAEKARKAGLHETAIAIMDKMRADRAAIDQDLNAQTVEAAMQELRDISNSIDFAGMFGRGGEAARDMTDAVKSLTNAQASHRALINAAGGDAAQIAKADALYRSAQIAGNLQLIGSAKGLFKEKSAGYKAIHAIEKAMAIWEMANSIRSMAMGKAESTQAVGDSMTRAAADQAAGASKIFSQLGMWAFPVVGAMIAVLASLGMKGGKSSAGIVPPSPEDLQASFGTGTVFGAADAQSESIARSLEIIAANTNADLEFSNQALRTLRSIDGGILQLAGQLGQQIGLGGAGMFDTSRLGLGVNGKSGVLGIGGKSTTRNLYDQGLQIYGQSVSDILAGNFNAQVYNVVEQIKKKKGVFGIGGGTKTSYFTSYGAIDAEIRNGFAEVLGGVADGVVSVTGLYSAQIADDLQVLIGQMRLPGVQFSTQGMSLDEIEKALQSYFGSMADQIAGLAAQQMPVLNELRRAGEGMFETLTRVVKTFGTVNVGLSSIGMGGFAHGDAGLRSAAELTDLFGDLDAYQDAIGKFGDKFLTEAERMAPIIDAVRAEMDRLGHSGVVTSDQFKSLVLGMDLSSAAGREMFAELMAVAPAFAKIIDYMGALDGTVSESSALMNKRRSLEIQIMELQGRTAEALAAKRAQELEALEEVLRPMQLYIYALQDEATAKTALKTAWERESKEIITLRDKFADLGKVLRDYHATLGNDANPANAYQKAAAEFGIAADAARLGDADAMQKLSQLGQAFLGQSMGNASSQIDYLRDVARVTQAVSDAIGAADEATDYQQAQLDALQQLVARHIDLNDNVLSVRDAILALEAAQQHIVAVGADVGPIPVVQTAPAPSNDAEVMALREEIADLNSKMETLIGGMNRTADATEKTNSKYLARVVDDDALRVREVD